MGVKDKSGLRLNDSSPKVHNEKKFVGQSSYPTNEATTALIYQYKEYFFLISEQYFFFPILFASISTKHDN